MNMQLTEVVKHLLILNILLFVADQLIGLDMLAMYNPTSEHFQSYQLVSHFFMHGSIGHIFFNMLALFLFGTTIEGVWGPKRFLFYYLFCAFGAAALHLAINYYQIGQLESLQTAFSTNPNYTTFNHFFEKVPFGNFNVEYHEEVDKIGIALNNGDLSTVPYAIKAMQSYVDFVTNTPMLGASGAIFGIMLAFGILFPEREIGLMLLPVFLKAKHFIPIMMILELYLGQQRFEWDNVAHYAHLGGALFGALLILFWHKRGDRLY